MAARAMRPIGMPRHTRRRLGFTSARARGMHGQAYRLSGPDRAEIPPRCEHRDGGDRVGGSAALAGSREDVVGCTGDGGWTGVLWPAEWRVCSGGRARREGALAVPDERPYEGFAHDVQLGGQAVHRGGGRTEYSQFRFVRLALATTELAERRA